MSPPCRCTILDQIGDDLVIGAHVPGRAQIGDVAAGPGNILTETEIDAAGRVFVVIEGVVGQSIAEHRCQIGAIGELHPHRQRRLTVIEAIFPGQPRNWRCARPAAIAVGVGKVVE